MDLGRLGLVQRDVHLLREDREEGRIPCRHLVVQGLLRWGQRLEAHCLPQHGNGIEGGLVQLLAEQLSQDVAVVVATHTGRRSSGVVPAVREDDGAGVVNPLAHAPHELRQVQLRRLRLPGGVRPDRTPHASLPEAARVGVVALLVAARAPVRQSRCVHVGGVCSSDPEHPTRRVPHGGLQEA